ncbi:MAG: Coenzyme F420 hydrogenase/dehydrogenase, beta subunit C-terminal domain, partial [Deltaproteobacteria bacterium]|nr:Coenzyme F420 hydrogenase/dehydrogenase, beta subunit C-terminal domain [Deltaproteobacteria bacterium]
MAFAMESIQAFADRGYIVDLVINSLADPPLMIDNPRVRIHKYSVIGRGIDSGLFVEGWRLSRIRNYDYIIGVGEIGLIFAGIIGKARQCRYLYYNTELHFGNEKKGGIGKAYGHTVKYLERYFNRKAWRTVTQDSWRGDILAKENRIDTGCMRFLPNSRSGKAKLSKSTYLLERFDFQENTKILLWIGGAYAGDGALELAQAAQDWPDGYRVVFHFGTKKMTDYKMEIAAYHGKGGVYISLEPLPYGEVEALVSSATIGLGIYADKGINSRLIGYSSGKINLFLKYGIPCIVSDYEGLHWVQQSGAGLCIESPHDILVSAERIIGSYHNYQRAAMDVFDRLLSFDNAFEKLAQELEKGYGGMCLGNRGPTKARRRDQMGLYSIEDVVKKDLCISCGACIGVLRPGDLRMKENRNKGMYLPAATGTNDSLHSGIEFEICPGKGYPIVAMGEELFGRQEKYDQELGFFKELLACRSTDKAILKNATSGGVMTAVAAFLLSEEIVQGAVVTRVRYGRRGPRPETFIARSKEELMEAQGSKYAPVPALTILPEINEFQGRLAFMGTPCQIAAIRLLQERCSEVKNKIYLCVGSVCGGFRELRHTDTIIKRSGMRADAVRYLRYRGGGQPGSMVIEDMDGRYISLPYPGYFSRTGYMKPKRCALCVDACAELADISCGDAWLPRYQGTGEGWSIVITRSDKGNDIVHKMCRYGQLSMQRLTRLEIREAQKENIISKKVRQNSRRYVYSLFRQSIPVFDGGFDTVHINIPLEVNVLFRRFFFNFIERIG